MPRTIDTLPRIPNTERRFLSSAGRAHVAECIDAVSVLWHRLCGLLGKGSPLSQSSLVALNCAFVSL
jgi:hypothetical protein